MTLDEFGNFLYIFVTPRMAPYLLKRYCQYRAYPPGELRRHARKNNLKLRNILRSALLALADLHELVGQPSMYQLRSKSREMVV